MKSTVGAVFKKELKRFFSDKKMAIVTIFLPGLMIFLMYNFMGGAIANLMDDEESYTICTVNLPDEFKAGFNEIGFTAVEIRELDIDEAAVKEGIADGTGYDALAVFPENFMEQVSAYDSTLGGQAPQVAVYYNSTHNSSAAAFAMMEGSLNAFEQTLINKFDINNGAEQYDLADEKDIAGSFFAMLMPMLLMMFLYSGCMAAAVESIAGEKERGTIATLLVTPAKRGSIAMGKILALSVIALLSGTSSTIGTVTSLPKLMGDAAAIDGSFYTVSDYAVLAVVIMSTVLVLVTLIAIVSAFAKSVKESQSYVLPIMVIVMIIGISGMFGDVANNTAFYLIPLYNSVQCMSGIFSFNVDYVKIAVTAFSNLVYAGLGVFALTKIFNSEKIMF